jgi:cytosine/adenosine deaminase-related metal-dependent hydrolase
VRLAAADLLGSGVTTVHAWEHNCRTPEHVDAELTALRDSGIRAHYSYGYFHQFPPRKPTDFTDIARARDEWTSERITIGFASRGVSSNPPEANPFPTVPRELRQLEVTGARAEGLRVTYHVGPSGCPPENYTSLAGPDVLFVHGYQWGPDTWATFADLGASVSMAPYSAAGYRMPPPYQSMLDAQLTVGLSFDYLGGPGSSDMFRVVQLSHVMNQLTGQSVTDRQLLEMATIGGARALGLGDVTGSLTAGKAADIIIVRTDVIGMTPFSDPYRALVNSARVEHIADVIVGGQIVKRDGALVAMNIPEIIGSAQSTLRRVMAAAGMAVTTL